MPRYYFNLYDDLVAVDDEGMELPDMAAAHAQAVASARALIADQALQGRICLQCRIEVEDEDRRPVLVLPFKDVVEIEP